MRKQGMTYRNIAIVMKRNHSALVRKAKHGWKIDRYPKLKEDVIKLMKVDRYSPEMIAEKIAYNCYFQ